MAGTPRGYELRVEDAAEVDVNPLFAGPDGVIAVDALVVPSGATESRPGVQMT